MIRRGGLLTGLLLGTAVSLIFVFGFAFGAAFDRHELNSRLDVSDPDVQNFLAAYHLVTQRSYYRPLDKRQLLNAAIDGMLKVTHDPHTLYLSATQNRQANADLNGTAFSGIGAIVVPDRRALRIVAPMPGSPAEEAGLRPGDIVLSVDGRTVSGMSSQAAIARIHGPSGTIVHLTVVRGHGTPHVFAVRRARIAPVTAYARLLPHRLGYLQIFSFGDKTSDQTAQALSMLEGARVRGIVLDLRANPGGYVDAAQKVVSDFVPRGTVAYEQQNNGRLSALRVLEGKQLARQPLAVLVDGGTASAAEITAAALRDDRHAVLVGTTTYGKGSMQSVYALSDGSTLRLTERLWLTPSKQSINGHGLVPDIVVAPAGGGTNDPQLNAAERYLLSGMNR